MLDIALPKGRLGDRVYKTFKKIGYFCPEMEEDNRKLIFTGGDVRYLLIKPSDVAVYVERGAADIGVVGKDVIEETSPDVYELMDLGFGRCRMCVCARDGYAENTGAALRVATKYPNIASAYYKSINREIEIIKLNGSIELAPILDLSDVIVDIVETGSTLKQNHLHVEKEIMNSSARLICSKKSFGFKQAEIEDLLKKLETVAE